MVFSVQSHAQGSCATEIPTGPRSTGCDVFEPGFLEVVDGQCDPINDDEFLLRVFVHIVRDDNGNGGQPLRGC